VMVMGHKSARLKRQADHYLTTTCNKSNMIRLAGLGCCFNIGNGVFFHKKHNGL
jgi:hypothetical protein